MIDNIFSQKFGNGNIIRNSTLNDRYHKRSLTLTKDSNTINNNIKINHTISGKNS